MMGYAELAVTTNFSFLHGASHAGELVPRAAALGLAAIGVADRNTLAGVPVVGTSLRITMSDYVPHNFRAKYTTSALRARVYW